MILMYCRNKDKKPNCR